MTGTFSTYTDQTNVSVNAIRSAFVTYAKEHAKGEGMMESIAGAMRHTVHYQQSVYDKRSHNDKIKKGLHFASRELFKSLDNDEYDDDDQAGPSSTSTPVHKKRRVSEEDVSAVVAPGEVVAVKCNDGHGKIRFAKVVRADDQTALLAEMTVTSEGMYRPALGTKARWNEPIRNVVPGIDVTFDEERRAYRVYTTSSEIMDS